MLATYFDEFNSVSQRLHEDHQFALYGLTEVYKLLMPDVEVELPDVVYPVMGGQYGGLAYLDEEMEEPGSPSGEHRDSFWEGQDRLCEAEAEPEQEPEQEQEQELVSAVNYRCNPNLRCINLVLCVCMCVCPALEAAVSDWSACGVCLVSHRCGWCRRFGRSVLMTQQA